MSTLLSASASSRVWSRIFPASLNFCYVNPVFAADEQAAETNDFIHGFPEPLLRQIKDACVLMDRRHQGSNVDVGVADSAYENAWRRNAVDVFAIASGARF